MRAERYSQCDDDGCCDDRCRDRADRARRYLHSRQPGVALVRNPRPRRTTA